MLKVLDILGKQVEILIDRKLKPGKYIESWNPGNLPSGVYLGRMVTIDSRHRVSETTRAMVLVK